MPGNEQPSEGQQGHAEAACWPEATARDGCAEPHSASREEAQDEGRRLEAGRDGGDEQDAQHTAETARKNSRQDILAVAPPAHCHRAAHQPPAHAKAKRYCRTRAQATRRRQQRWLKRCEPQPADGPPPHRRIGEARNPGPQSQLALQPHQEPDGDPNPRSCIRCGSRWQRNTNRALQAIQTPCMACGARGPQHAAEEQNLRPTLLHFLCTTCAWSSCPRCAGGPGGTGTQQTRRPNETGTPMTDQAKRRRSTTPDARDELNTPGPSSKLPRRGQSDRRRSDEASDSSASEIQLPDSVRRILDFEEWAAATSTSSSEEYSDATPRSIPLLPPSEHDIPTPTGVDFTDFLAEIQSPASSSGPTATQPATAPDACDETATPLITPTQPRWAQSPGDHELTDGFITETDIDVPRPANPTQLLTERQPHGECDPSEWTPPPKRHSATASTSRTAQATIIDETDEPDRERAGPAGGLCRAPAHGVADRDMAHAMRPRQGAATDADSEHTPEASRAHTTNRRAQRPTNEDTRNNDRDAMENHDSPNNGQAHERHAARPCEHETATPAPPEERAAVAPSAGEQGPAEDARASQGDAKQDGSRAEPAESPCLPTPQDSIQPASLPPVGPVASATPATRGGDEQRTHGSGSGRQAAGTRNSWSSKGNQVPQTGGPATTRTATDPDSSKPQERTTERDGRSDRPAPWRGETVRMRRRPQPLEGMRRNNSATSRRATDPAAHRPHPDKHRHGTSAAGPKAATHGRTANPRRDSDSRLLTACQTQHRWRRRVETEPTHPATTPGSNRCAATRRCRCPPDGRRRCGKHPRGRLTADRPMPNL